MDEASFELTFSPNVTLVGTVRRFVADFYRQILGDNDATARLALATHELLENAVRYSSDGNTSIHIGVRPAAAGSTVVVETRNAAVGQNIQIVRDRLDALVKAEDAMAHYHALMRQSAKRTDGSGLGLGRIRAEAEMALSYRIEGSIVHLRAEAFFEKA